MLDVSTSDGLQILRDKRDVTVKSFDITNSSLPTDNGAICLPSFSGTGLTKIDPEVQRFKECKFGWYVDHLELGKSATITRVPPTYFYRVTIDNVYLGLSSEYTRS